MVGTPAIQAPKAHVTLEHIIAKLDEFILNEDSEQKIQQFFNSAEVIKELAYLFK